MGKKERKKGGVEGGKQKNKKRANAENNRLKKKQRPHNPIPNVVPNSRYRLRLHELLEPVHIMHETADR